MSFLSDIAELAKAGYKPQDVKELLSLSKPESDASPLPGEPAATPSAANPLPGEPAGEPSKNVQPAAEPTKPTEKPAETAPKESAPPAGEPDYKALYEAEKEKVKDLQNKNTNADISQNNGNYEAELLEAIRDFC